MSAVLPLVPEGFRRVRSTLVAADIGDGLVPNAAALRQLAAAVDKLLCCLLPPAGFQRTIGGVPPAATCFRPNFWNDHRCLAVEYFKGCRSAARRDVHRGVRMRRMFCVLSELFQK
jgi:hypothetical protein